MATILIAEDSRSIRGLVAKALTEAGFDVVAAADGREALEKAEVGAFDLVITDINMPRMNGIELVTELRKLQQFRFMPIIVLTTESSPEMKLRGKSAGATGWLVKPFDPELLLRAIARALD